MTQTEQFKAVLKIYQNLTAEWNRDDPDVNLCEEKLKELKLGLIKLGHMPTEITTSSKHELLIARDTLEIGARWAITTHNIPEFESYINQLKTFYFDYRSALPDSAYMSELLGLNLLCLLAQGKLADFHAELERIQVDELHKNIYIQYPVTMEQYLMEGCYNHLFLSRTNVPSDRYNYFIDILLETTRDEIAKCIEAGYDSLPKKEASRLLFFKSKKSGTPLLEFAKKRNWQLSEDQTFIFRSPTANNPRGVKELEQNIWQDVASTLMVYAKDLDTII